MIGEQIKVLRNELNLTQMKFAEKLGVKRNTVGQWEIGRNIPTDTAISLMCKEFNVNEEWLRSGKGEMFTHDSRKDRISELAKQLLSKETDTFKNIFITILSNLTEDQWEILAQKAMELYGMNFEQARIQKKNTNLLILKRKM